MTAVEVVEPSVGGGVLEATDLRVVFPAGRGRRLVAVDGVDLSLPSGGSLGLVGESGCGKTTVAKALVGLQPLTAGTVRLGGQDLTGKRSQQQRRAIQMVFQDPGASLNPRMTVRTVLAQLLSVHFDQRGDAATERINELLDLVGLPASTAGRYPRELSGGQRQRVSIARALAVKPQVIVADEPTSALDVSVQATILRLFADLRAQLGISLIFISHNLAATRAICDRVDVMYLGRLVESGSRSAVFDRPSHPYTRALMTAAPELAGTHQTITRSGLSGELPSLSEVPAGCRLHPRCPRAEAICSANDPALAAVASDPDHLSACHFRDEPAAVAS